MKETRNMDVMDPGFRRLMLALLDLPHYREFAEIVAAQKGKEELFSENRKSIVERWHTAARTMAHIYPEWKPLADTFHDMIGDKPESNSGPIQKPDNTRQGKMLSRNKRWM